MKKIKGKIEFRIIPLYFEKKRHKNSINYSKDRKMYFDGDINCFKYMIFLSDIDEEEAKRYVEDVCVIDGKSGQESIFFIDYMNAGGLLSSSLESFFSLLNASGVSCKCMNKTFLNKDIPEDIMILTKE